MASYNKVILLGNLTRDPELRHTQGGNALAKFGIATNEYYTTADGVKKQRTTFVDVTAWNQGGETIAKYLKKGDPIFIEGRLDFSSWEDKATGKNRSKLEVVVLAFEFVGGRKPDATETSRTSAAEPNKSNDPDYGEIPF